MRDYSRNNVFQDVNVYPIVFLIQNNNQKHDVSMTTMKTVDEVSTSKRIPSDIFYQDIYWDRYFTSKEVLDIIIKMSKLQTLDYYFADISAAATVNEAYEIKKVIKNHDASKIRKNLLIQGL